MSHGSITSRTIGFGLTIFLLLGVSGRTSKSAGAKVQECSVEIVSPKAGVKVRRDALVSGTAQLPANGYLWVLAHKKGLKQWWPQGEGEVEIQDGKWDVLVKFGKEGANENGIFEIAAVVVDKQGNEDLKRWVEDAPKNGYLPTNFPNPLQNCPIARVSVDKVGD